jgi:hypothetical protein
LSSSGLKFAFYITHLQGAHPFKNLMTGQSPLKVEMFEEREAAAKWLGVPVELLMAKV